MVLDIPLLSPHPNCIVTIIVVKFSSHLAFSNCGLGIEECSIVTDGNINESLKMITIALNILEDVFL